MAQKSASRWWRSPELYEALLSRSKESIDIDAIVNRWPDLAEEERRIDELFHHHISLHRDTGLRPVRSDSPVSEAHFIAIALAEKGKLETACQAPDTSATSRTT